MIIPVCFLTGATIMRIFCWEPLKKYALTTKTGGFSNYSQLAGKTADYIAITNGTRKYP